MHNKALSQATQSLEPMDDSYYQPSEEEERDFWNGIGSLVFTVYANRPDVFEIEVEDYSGCVGGFDETMGIEWGLKEGYLGIDRNEMREGYTYICNDIEVDWYRGDGWTTDDDVEYYVGDVRSKRLPLIPYMKLVINNAWWFNVGWRIRAWKNGIQNN